MGTMLAINGNIINSQEPLPIPVDYDYLGETTGTTEIEIPEGYNEVYCDIIDISSNTYYNTSFIPDFESRNRRGGYYFNASNYGGWIISWDASTRKAKLTGALSVGHDYTSTAKVKWYAMKHIVQSGGASRGSVSVTADGTKTYGQLLNELFALVDFNKINYNSKLIHTMVSENTSTDLIYDFKVITKSSNTVTECYFVDTRISSNSYFTGQIKLSSSSSAYVAILDSTITNYTNNTVNAGFKFTIVY